MKEFTSKAIFLIASCALSTGAQCQEVFRCGDSYSQKPCANAVVVNVDDARSPAQKAEADAVTRRELASANAMEKARLKEEAQLRERNAKAALAQAKADAKSRAKSDASAPATKAKAKKNQAKKKKEAPNATARPTNAASKTAISPKK